MGLSISYLSEEYVPDDDEPERRLFVRSLSFNNLKTLEDLKSPPALLNAMSSRRLKIKGSTSFTLISPRYQATPKRDNESYNHKHSKSSVRRYGPRENLPPDSPVVKMTSPKYKAAAVTLQKVYKSFRTRRQLADCAVLVEQRWWKLLDYALLKHSSVSFFEMEKQESALSRWNRARMRVANVGKGLSKDEKAQKLALQHWLEAIDPRHRYGHNLHFYYQHWLHCESQQPFFYWLDVGDGKEVNLEDKCPRWKLLQQCIRYLGPKEREVHEVILENRRMMYKVDRKIVDTSEGPKDAKWIFVLSTTKALYIGVKSKGLFQHSSFLAGGATSAAGRLVVVNGILKAIWPHSGHYKPTEANFRHFMRYLKKLKVDLTNVKLSPSEDEEDACQMPSFEDMKSQSPHIKEDDPATPPFCSPIAATTVASSPAKMKRSSSGNRLQRKRPPRLSLSKNVRLSKVATEQDAGAFGDSRLDFCKENLFRRYVGEECEDEVVVVPQEKILHRISSKLQLNSYQLGKQLSSRWSTGAGPRIGCVRDYPPELQLRAMEQVSLSPCGGARPPRVFIGTPRKSPCASVASPLGGGGTSAPLLQHGAA